MVAKKKKSQGAAHQKGSAPNTQAAVSPQQLIQAYREMFRARKIDEKAIILYKQNKCHFQIGVAGHEAVQVAAADCLRPGYDWAYPYYRDMAFCAAWGMTNREFFLNILNKAADPNSGGRHMPMHYGHRKLQIVNQSSPTGTQYLQAVGAAMAVRYRSQDAVVFVSSGEGATAQGDYHEALNWAAQLRLPVLFLIENNKYAISVHISEEIAGESVSKISSGYEGLAVHTIDGLDYLESYSVCYQAVERARSGQGPSVIEAQVVRLQSHSISDNQLKYRPTEEIKGDKLRDPLRLFEEYLQKQTILDKDKLQEIQCEIQTQIDGDAQWAEEQPDPIASSCEAHVFVNANFEEEVEETIPSGEELFLVDALTRALDEELAHDPEMVIFGQDVAYGKGGVFTVTAGLTAKYGVKRVFNSPLAEASIVGAAVGLATLGMKPVTEIQFGDYVWTGMMQIRNELALMCYRSNGDFSCPAVIRIPIGGYIHGGIYHSQNLEATFAHFPGLIVILPSNATDAKGLLKSAIRAKDPVLFLEHKGLYRQVYAKGKIGGPDDLIPIGKAKVIREGLDATVVTWGALVQKSLLAAQTLERSDVHVEVIDLRTIYPLDIETIRSSVKKTSRLLIAHEDVLFMGFGAEIAASIGEYSFEYLDAPIMRVGGLYTPIPHSPILEEAVLPQTQNVEEALRRLVSY